MNTLDRHKYFTWKIEDGDYKIDYESTRSYQLKIIRRRKIKNFLKVSALVLVVIFVVSYAITFFTAL